MRRLMAAMILCLAAVWGAAPAGAVEVKASGEYLINFQFLRGTNFYEAGWDDESEDTFGAHQRVNLQLEFVASEHLKGVLNFEIGQSQWGRPQGGFGFDGDGVNVKTKHAYIQFDLPNTEVTFQVGLQPLALPGAVMNSNPIVDNDAAMALASWQISDEIAVTGLWARLLDLDANNTLVNNSSDVDEADLWGLVATYEHEGLSIKPYVLLARTGKDAVRRGLGGPTADDPVVNMLSPVARFMLEGFPTDYDGIPDAQFDPGFVGPDGQPLRAEGSQEWMRRRILADQDAVYTLWTGSAFQLELEPVTIMADVLWGKTMARNTVLERTGFYVAGEVDYKMDFATLGVFGWWSTGEDGDWRNGSEQLPMLSGGSGGFKMTSFGFHGSLFDDVGQEGLFYDGPAGKWAIGLVAKDLSFIDDLTHTIKVLYGRGTNSPESRRYTGLMGGLGIFPTTQAPDGAPTIGMDENGVETATPNPANPVFPSIVGTKRPGSALASPQSQIAAGQVLDVHSRDYRAAFQGIQLTTNDSYWEVNLDSTYQIYENLNLVSEIGFAHVAYGGSDIFVHRDTVSAWKALIGLQFSF